MFEVDHIDGAMILTADPVRMTPERAKKIGEFVKAEGQACSAFVLKDEQGDVLGVELFAGDSIRRQAFQQQLTRELLG